MDIRWGISITDLMSESVTYGEAERLYRDGRIDQTDWDLYRFYWRNGSPRFSEVAAEFEIRAE